LYQKSKTTGIDGFNNQAKPVYGFNDQLISPRSNSRWANNRWAHDLERSCNKKVSKPTKETTYFVHLKPLPTVRWLATKLKVEIQN